VKRILLATDGSEPALEATRVAIEIAEEHGAELLVAHVVREIDVVPATVLQIGTVVPHRPAAHDLELLEDAAARAREHGVEATTVLLRGETVDELVRYASVRDVDLIVVGSRGHGAVAGALLGSVSQALLRESRRPVLIVRAAAAVATEARR
jgi:nucleotide-binding universal stress UspA family protein